MRLRAFAGIAVALLAVAAAGPPAWLPWTAAVRDLLPAWWQVPVLASGLLLLAAAILPGEREAPTRPHGENVALGLGVLLLVEPLVHLAVLAYLSWRWAPGADDLLLPPHAVEDPLWLAPRLLVFGLLAPLAEEAFFRGRLLPWLVPRLGRWSALSFTTLAFAAAHGSPIACVVALPVGLALGWLRLARHDVAACVVVHQAHNALLLLAGPGLGAAPVTAALLAAAGALLVALAAARGGLGWRAFPAALALIAVAALLARPAFALQDRLWSAATARLLARRSADPAVLIPRLDRELRCGRLTDARCRTLRPALTGDGSTVRAAALLLDGPAALAADAAEAETRLEAARAVPRPPPRLAAAAAAVGIAWPEALAAVAIEDPAAIAAWFDVDGLRRAICAAQGGPRKRLLAALERAWPGRLAPVLLALPAAEVTPIDRRHLRANYPDADRLIDALDDERQAAWLGEASPSSPPR